MVDYFTLVFYYNRLYAKKVFKNSTSYFYMVTFIYVPYSFIKCRVPYL